MTWNISNVGAIATVESESYGVSLATVGLLTTALFVTHLAVQIPGGRLIDRVGARNVGLVALVIVAAGNAIALTSPTLEIGLGARALMGLGTGVGFVAGIDLVRSGQGGALWQGAYGGSTMAAAGLALMVIPQLVGELGWRAPFWTGLVLALIGLLPVLATRRATPTRQVGDHDQPSRTVAMDRRLWPLAAVQMASFGLSVVAGNWIVTLLEREGHSRSSAGIVGGLILFAGIVTRPAGGLLMRRTPDRAWAFVATALVAGSTGVLVLAAAPPLWLGAVAALVVGLSAGLPFAPIFNTTLRLRPDAPAAAIGFVNGSAVLVILVGTPLAGLTFGIPGDGRVGFLIIGLLWASALLAVRKAARS
ncbi:MFS transporter [Gaiella sp.]|uniref:MFS transporter n=1 Tax=Gaiella sp. TaxID=2663207 RepID=UPI0039838099